MRDEDLLKELEALAARQAIRITYEDFTSEGARREGGSCRVREERRILVNKRLPLKARIRVVARGLGKLDLSGEYLPPKVRTVIEEAREE
jgi:hypothetical protein